MILDAFTCTFETEVLFALTDAEVHMNGSGCAPVLYAGSQTILGTVDSAPLGRLLAGVQARSAVA